MHSLSISLNDMDNIQNFFDETPIFETKVTYDVDPETNKRIESSRKVIEAKFNVLPVNANGDFDSSDYSNGGTPQDVFDRINRPAGTTQKIYPCVAIAVRVKNKASDVDAYVDLAPAGWGGDEA